MKYILGKWSVFAWCFMCLYSYFLTVLNHLYRQCAEDFDDSAPFATRSKEKLMVLCVVEVPGHSVGKIKSIGFRILHFSCSSCKQWPKNMENIPTCASRNANLDGGADSTVQ